MQEQAATSWLINREFIQLRLKKRTKEIVINPFDDTNWNMLQQNTINNLIILTLTSLTAVSAPITKALPGKSSAFL